MRGRASAHEIPAESGIWLEDKSWFNPLSRLMRYQGSKQEVGVLTRVGRSRKKADSERHNCEGTIAFGLKVLPGQAERRTATTSTAVQSTSTNVSKAQTSPGTRSIPEHPHHVFPITAPEAQKRGSRKARFQCCGRCRSHQDPPKVSLLLGSTCSRHLSRTKTTHKQNVRAH